MSNVQCPKVNKRGLLKFGLEEELRAGAGPLPDVELIRVAPATVEVAFNDDTSSE
jgi:hypothetical protein